MRVKTQDNCNILWCKRPHYAHGYCHTHWTAIRRFGNPFGRHKEEYDIINDIIERTRDLVDTVFYPPGPTRDQYLYSRAQKLKEIIGSK